MSSAPALRCSKNWTSPHCKVNFQFTNVGKREVAELRHWHKGCLTMVMGKRWSMARLGRLFVIKTRWEAWAVIWAITMGAIERGKHYLDIFPGALGWTFFALCTGVVFIAGAKLLDSVRDESTTARPATALAAAPHRPRRVSRNRPRSFRLPAGSASPRARRRD